MFFATVLRNICLLSISLEFHIIDIVYFHSSYYATLINFIIYCHISDWICKNGAKDFHPYHPFFSMISQTLRPLPGHVNGQKIGDRRAMKGR